MNQQPNHFTITPPNRDTPARGSRVPDARACESNVAPRRTPIVTRR